MAVLCFILGQSGTGKSTSLRNFQHDEVAYVNVSGKPLPFKGKFSEMIASHNYDEITKFIKRCAAKSIVIDDSTFLMSFQKWDKAFEKNFDKWTELGKNFSDLLRTCVFNVSNDKIVYFLHHTDTSDDGRITAKCLGKMINQDATLEAFFTIVLSTSVVDSKYYFLTQNSGKDTTKSPYGMFPAYAIDNDLKYVDDKIRNFYEIGEYKSDDEMNQEDVAVAADIEKPDANGRRSRSGRSTKTATETTTPPQTASEQGVSTGRRARKTHDEVVEENQQKMAEYQKKVDDAIDEATGGAEEVDFDTACEIADSIEKPELETPPRRTRKERQLANATGSETVDPNVCSEDTYFYIAANDNYVMKHKGDAVPEGGQVISKEEYGKGIKRIAQGNNAVEEAMNPPEQGTRSRRTRRTR